MSENSPEIGSLTYAYDDLGRPIKRDTDNGLSTKVTYDKLNRIDRRIVKDNGQNRIVTRFTYDSCDNGDGKLCQVRHNDHVTRYNYTPDGHLAGMRVRFEGETVTERLRYVYRDDSQLRTMHYPSGLTVRYHYDMANIVNRITARYETGDDRETIVLARNIMFDENTGQIMGFTHGNGIKTRFAYNDQGQLIRTTLKDSGQKLDQTQLVRDDNNRITKINRLNATDTQRFTYDPLGRLIKESRGDGSAAQTHQISYSYDAVGNRLSRTEDGAPRNYNYAPDANRLDRINRATLTYDARGNLIKDKKGRRSFVYDAMNRMAEFYRNGQLRAQYSYDADGRRVRKQLTTINSDGTRFVRYLYDTDSQLISETMRRTDRSAVKARDIVWLGRIPLAQINRRVKPSGETVKATAHFIHVDHLGAPFEARNDAGTAVWRWTRDAFGAGPDAQRNAGVDRDPDGDGIKTEISLRFPGQYHDRESGLFYNHHRDYDPSLGRYIQSDPIGLEGGVNRYAYVSADPVNLIDPTGLSAIGRVLGGMYHKDAHDGPGGLYGPGGQLEQAYIMFNLYTTTTFGMTGMEYMAHPDGSNYLTAIAGYCTQMTINLLRQSPSDAYYSYQISYDRTFPDSWRAAPYFSRGYGLVAQRAGNHENNYRIPYTGLHIGTESDERGVESDGLYIHHDFYDPTMGLIETINHNRFEVGPLNRQEIESRIAVGFVPASRACISGN